jgi:hypothetical protein
VQPNTVTTIPGRSTALIGAWLQLLFVPGAIGGAFAFGYAVDGPAATDPDFITRLVLIFGIGLMVGIVGLVLLCVALLSNRYRAGWFFWFLVLYGSLLILIIPVGTAFGLFFLIYCLARRREFLGRDETQATQMA